MGLSRDKYFVNPINPAQKCHPRALKHSLAKHLISENVNVAWVKHCQRDRKYVEVGRDLR